MVINQETSKPLEKLILKEKNTQTNFPEILTVKDGDLEVIITNQ